MIIGHLPAGYVASKLFFRRSGSGVVGEKLFLLAGVLGGIAPDLDMIYFYLIDHRQHHHHTYFTHFPVVWGTLLAASLFWLLLERKRSQTVLALIFTLNAFIHLLLDSIVGDVWWLAPFGNDSFALFTVPALYTPWWLNFLLHWSFAIELAILLWAAHLWRGGTIVFFKQKTTQQVYPSLEE